MVAVSEGGQWRADNLSPNQVGTPAEQQVLESIVDYFLICYFGLIGLVVLARGVRALAERRAGMINLSGYKYCDWSTDVGRPNASLASTVTAGSMNVNFGIVGLSVSPYNALTSGGIRCPAL